MHPRNLFKIKPPNYEELALNYPNLRAKCFIGAGGKVCINFQDPEAIRILSEILLEEYFEIKINIPTGVLVPRIPQRLNYILLIEDLIIKNGKHNSPVLGIDIGTGGTCIFPILGAKIYGWKFLASDINKESVEIAKLNVKKNSLGYLIDVLHTNGSTIFKELLTAYESPVTFSMCNPPFYDYEEASLRFVERDGNLQNTVGISFPRSGTTAIENEISYEGGEVSFIYQMIEESLQFRDKISFYTSMVGKKTSLNKLSLLLNENSIRHSIYTERQGRTTRWFLTWTFCDNFLF